MNPSSQTEPLDILIGNAKKGSGSTDQPDTVPFGLKARVLAEINEDRAYDRLSFWRRSSLAFTGMSLAVIFFMNLDLGPKSTQPAAAILPLPALDLGDAPTPVK